MPDLQAYDYWRARAEQTVRGRDDYKERYECQYRRAEGYYRDLAAAREKARKWEWVARDIAAAFATKDAILTDALARYQSADEATTSHVDDPPDDGEYSEYPECEDCNNTGHPWIEGCDREHSGYDLRSWCGCPQGQDMAAAEQLADEEK